MGRPVRLACAAMLTLLLASAVPTEAQSLDQASQEALATTLRMLTDPGLRGAALGKDPKAAGVDSQMRGMVGEKHMAEFYELAAQIFEDLTRGSGGDVQKMTQALERGKSDPTGFAAMLSPRTLERLRAFSSKISDRPR